MNNTTRSRWRSPARGVAVAGMAAALALGLAGTPAAGAGGSAPASDPTEAFASQFADVTDSTYKAKVRWWWPGAYSSDEEIVREVNEIADAGFGGFEIADVYDSVTEELDPEVYGWGTDNWNHAVEVALQAAKDRGLVVNITVGPHWPSTVPTIDPDSEASSKEITFGQLAVAGGTVYQGDLPDPFLDPSGVTAGNPDPQPLTTELLKVFGVQCADTCSDTGTVALDESTIVDLTDLVVDRQISWDVPEGDNWLLLPVYTRPTGQIVNMFDMNPAASAVTDPQSYVVDHFGAAGSQAVIDYWDSTLLTPAIRELLEEVGGTIFEDSIELKTTGYWTPGMLDEFEADQGYDVSEYLPLVVMRTLGTFAGPGVSAFTFSDSELSELVLEDWDDTINQLWFENRLEPFTEWAESIGMEYRNQGYGTTVDSILSAALTGQPEGESLGFGSEVDRFRAVASGRDMGGTSKLSDEMGAFFGAYATTWNDQMLPTLNRDFSGGVNELYIHGYATDDAPGVEWPGFSAFGTMFAEPWNGKQPTWTAITDMTGYINRTQLVLQQGTNTVDVAFLRQDLDIDGGYFEDQSVVRAGYSTGYLSPGVLELPSATVTDGVLAADGPSYQALIVDDEQAMELATAEKLLELAEDGLPIIVVGGVPERTIGRDVAGETSDMQDVFDELLTTDGVTQVDEDSDVLDALADVVEPAVVNATAIDLYNVHRRADGADYYYLYNNTGAALSTSVELSGEGRPYVLDAWTGEIKPIAEYMLDGDRVVVDVSLESGAATIVALAGDDAFGFTGQARSATSTTADEVVVDGQRLMIRDSEAGTYETTLASGREVTSTVKSVPDATELTGWTLAIESWEPGDSATDVAKVAMDPVELDSLVPWSEIEGLEYVSGVGTYTTTLELGKSWTGGYGAYLDLGEHNDSVRVRVNGVEVGPVDQLDAVVDLGGYLHRGSNTIEVKVATSLYNVLLEVRDGFGAGGFGSLGTEPRAYGLTGPVVLQPYGEAVVAGR